MTQVLIAVDDSETSVNTARVAYALFGDTAGYTVVNVADQSAMMWAGDPMLWGVGYPVMMAPSGVVGPVPHEAHSDAEPARSEVDGASIDAAIQVARDVATEANLPDAQVVGEVGDPAMAILAAAQHHQADVIVIGSHDRSWFSRLFSPSVSGAVVKESHVPVLVAR
jgi:nucleotide-binding universal stress UspA family protein